MSGPGPETSAGTVTIALNGERREVAAGTTVLGLLRELEQDPRTVAVERNGEVLPRARHGEQELADGDRIEVVRFVQGG